jgi:hypothetical protein
MSAAAWTRPTTDDRRQVRIFSLISFCSSLTVFSSTILRICTHSRGDLMFSRHPHTGNRGSRSTFVSVHFFPNSIDMYQPAGTPAGSPPMAQGTLEEREQARTGHVRRRGMSGEKDETSGVHRGGKSGRKWGHCECASKLYFVLSSDSLLSSGFGVDGARRGGQGMRQSRQGELLNEYSEGSTGVYLRALPFVILLHSSQQQDRGRWRKMARAGDGDNKPRRDRRRGGTRGENRENVSPFISSSSVCVFLNSWIAADGARQAGWGTGTQPGRGKEEKRMVGEEDGTRGGIREEGEGGGKKTGRVSGDFPASSPRLARLTVSFQYSPRG